MPETHFPVVHELSKVLDRALWILANPKSEGREYLSADEIAQELTDVHKIATEAAAVRMAFKRAPNGLIHLKKDTRDTKGNTYAIMKNGEEYLTMLREPKVLLIEPEKAYSSRRKVEEFFQKLTGIIKICDPYVDLKTIDPLTSLPKGSRIRMVTRNVYDGNRLRREIEAYRKEFSDLEVRVSQDNLHDRYIIAKDNFWLVGHSLNGLGKKEAFIVNLGADIRSAIEPVFDKRWDNSKAL